MYNNYLHSASVFIAESGQPDAPFDRNFISKELNIVEDGSSTKLPLLYSILFGLKKEVYEPNYNSYTQNTQNNHQNIPNKFKEQSINMNFSNKDKTYFENKNDQPQPWLID